MTDGRLTHAEELTRVFRRIVGILLSSWQRILRVGLVIVMAAVAATELVSCLLTAMFPPPPVTHLVAVALAAALGYGVAVTMLLAMLLKGGLRLIRSLEGDVEFGAHAASIFARREASDLGAGIRRFIGTLGVSGALGTRGTRGTRGDMKHRARADTVKRPAATQRLSALVKGAVASPAASPNGMRGQEAIRVVPVIAPRASGTPGPDRSRPDARRDPDDAVIKAPAPVLQSLPVLASRLPRIEWTYGDQPVQHVNVPPWALPQQSTPTATPASAASSVPVVTVSSTDPETAAAAAMTNDVVDPPASPDAPAEAAEAAHPSGAPGEPRGTADVPGLIPRGWRQNGRITRPLPAVTRPLPEARSGGLWQRVSQALVGQPAASDAPAENSAENSADVTLAEPLAVSDALGNVASEDAWLNG